MGELIGVKKVKNDTQTKFSKKTLLLLTYLSVAIGFVFPIESLIINGISIETLLSFQNLLEVNNTMAVARYTNDLNTSVISQIALVFVYLAPLLAGFTNAQFKARKLLVISLLPSLMVLLTQNTKFVFICAIFLLVISRFSYFLVFKGRFPKFKLKHIVGALVGMLVFYFLVIFSFIARIGKLDEQVLEEVNYKVAFYFAHLPTFDDWLVNYLDKDIHFHEYGVKTFFGIANTLGIAERKAGIFDDNYYFYSNGREFHSNVYTVFRYHIEDFGFWGTFVFVFILGFIFGLLKSKMYRFSLLAVVVFSCLFFYVFNSYVSSIWAYMSFILVFILFYLSLFISKKRRYV